MATGVHVFTSSDASAPQLYGSAGSLTTILDAVLVNGYGSTSPAGTGGAGAWAITYTATNKRVYRPSAGNRFYLRVNDNAAGTGGAKEALVKGAESFSDIDTPTNPLPAAAQSALTENSLVVRKSATADGTTARPWLIAADDRTVMMWVLTGDAAGTYYGWMWGDIYSYKSGDGYRTMIVARNGENGALSSNEGMDLLYYRSDVGVAGTFVQRGYLGTGTAWQVSKTMSPNQTFATSSAYSIGAGGVMTYPNPGDSGLYCTPVFVNDNFNHASTYNLRGRLRGLWNGLHAVGSFNDGDTFTGTGDLAGKSFRIIKTTPSGGYYILETGDTWDTSS